MRPDFVQQALKALRPDTPNWYGWNVLSDGHSWENAIVIQDGVTKPTKEEFDAKVAELQAQYDADNAPYKLSRRAAYPPIEDQLDQIYHEGIDAWKETIAAVKAEYPKP